MTGQRKFKCYNHTHFTCFVKCAQIAQLVEQRTENPRVRGSNPRLGTIQFYIPIKLLIFHMFF